MGNMKSYQSIDGHYVFRPQAVNDEVSHQKLNQNWQISFTV